MDAADVVKAHGELIKARIATFKTLSNGERDEVFSRVCEKLVTKLETFEGRDGAQLKTWVYRLTVNEALMVIRAASRTTRSELDGDDFEAAHAHAHGEQSSPEAKVVRRSELHRAREALKPEDWELVMLAYGEGHELEDIAKDKGLPYDTVKMRLYRAKLKIRKILEES